MAMECQPRKHGYPLKMAQKKKSIRENGYGMSTEKAWLSIENGTKKAYPRCLPSLSIESA